MSEDSDIDAVEDDGLWILDYNLVSYHDGKRLVLEKCEGDRYMRLPDGTLGKVTNPGWDVVRQIRRDAIAGTTQAVKVAQDDEAIVDRDFSD